MPAQDMKGPTEKNFEGIYANSRLMHALGLVVGCICHVQVKNGTIYEGVLKTFSSRADCVLDMARRIDKKCPDPTPVPSPGSMQGKMIFKFDDVVTLTCPNVDPDFATRESMAFTDTAISKFNGELSEPRKLEPFYENASDSFSAELGGGEQEANGWDPDDMFHTNAVKYGVKSSFDDNLPEYTIPLNKSDSVKYKQQEAQASKIAHEIESSSRNRTNNNVVGDEEDRFSAVLRPNDNAFRFQRSRSNKQPSTRGMRTSPPTHLNRGGGSYRGVSSPHHRPPAPPRHQQPPPMQRQPPPSPPVSEVEPVKYAPKPPRSLHLQNNANKEMQRDRQQPPIPPPQQQQDRKMASHKAREEKTADLKRFQAGFKLCEEAAASATQQPELDEPKSDSPNKEEHPSTLNPNAKEFIFNPNAKTFTPRGVLVGGGLRSPQPPLVGPPPPTLMPIPHYVLPFNPPPPSQAQAPRFRKAAMPQPVHVQAATGQPILAQPHFTIQYQAQPHHQQLHYTQMYQIMPRVLTQQPVGMLPTPAPPYGDNPPQMPHLYMTGGSAPSTPHPMHPSPVHTPPALYAPGTGAQYPPGPQQIVFVPPPPPFGGHPYAPHSSQQM